MRRLTARLIPFGSRFPTLGLLKLWTSKVFAIQNLKSQIPNSLPIRQWLRWVVVGLSLTGIIAACSPAPNQPQEPEKPAVLNSRYTNEQPTLSGNGQYLAFVSNRDGDRKLVMYDLQKRHFIDLSRLNRPKEILESPSLSRTGRYMTYIASDRGHPEVELYDRVTQRSQVLTMGYDGLVRNPSISPDGRYIVFETSRRGQWDVEVLDRGSNIELDITDGSPASDPKG
jgi:Tol biopolymer transport system component